MTIDSGGSTTTESNREESSGTHSTGMDATARSSGASDEAAGEKSLRFIPLRRGDLVELCLRQGAPDKLWATDFRHFATLLNSLLHYEFHALQESFKRVYAAHDPNADTRFLTQLPADAGEPSLEDLLAQVLDKANYEKLTETDLQQALQESSLFKIRLQVDFDDFDEVLLFCRGASRRQETIHSLFGLRKQVVSFINYDRVVVYLKFKPQLQAEKPLCRPGSTLLKLFQDVPKADLEMLFPNTQVRMRLRDKLMIGVPAAVGGGIVVSTKLGGSLILLASLAGYWLGASDQPVQLDKAALLALMAGLGALGVHFWKQFNNFKNRKLRFIQTLTQNLYFKNLDNNAGVFYRLLDEAEEEEGKEALLAYYFLSQSTHPLSAQELDQRIEKWLHGILDSAVDFEIDDALQKLLRFGLVQGDAESGYSAVDLPAALKILDQRWDGLFPYAGQ